MSLRDASPPRPLPPGPPYACGELVPWEFTLPAGDPRLPAIHAGEREEVPAHAMIAGNVTAWAEGEAWMDFLDPASPTHALKRVELQLYLDRWERHLARGARVLDLGGGIGRFTGACLARDCEVELVDPDLRALRRAVRHAAGGPGKLDVHWTTGEHLPDLAPVDVVIAAEVLCYCEDPARVLANVRRVLKPGGVLLLSVEARWGWALTHDVVGGGLPALLGDGVVHVPGDRFVRTFDRDDLLALLAGWTVEECLATHYILSGPFEGVAGPMGHDEILRWEARLREHPVTAPWHRAWTVIAR